MNRTRQTIPILLPQLPKMPRLLIFAPCEKVIIGQGDNNVSLIGIIQNVQVHPKPDGTSKIPPNTLLQSSWNIFSLWQKEAEDDGVVYTQRVVLISRTGKTLVESITGFTMEKEWHRIITSVPGLPIGEAGTHTLKLSLRRVGSSDWNEISSFPLTITHPTPTRSSSVPH